MDEIRIAVVTSLAVARIAQVSGCAHAVVALAEHAVCVGGARRGGVGRQVGQRRKALPDPPQEDKGDLQRRPRRALLHAQQLVGQRPLVEPPLLRHEHVGRQERQRLTVVPGVQPPEAHLRGRAVVVDGRLAARHAGAVLVAPRLPDAVHLLVAERAEGGAAADDARPAGPHPELLDQRRHQIAPGEHQLVAVRQHVAVVYEAAAEGDVPVGGDAGAVDDGAAAHHAHGRVAEGDLGHPERAVAEEQLASPPVACQVEPWPVAAWRPEAERVWHAHAAAAGAAVAQPYRCRWCWSLCRGRRDR
jgi:hypothetical protein